MKTNRKFKFLSLVLCLIMILSLMPAIIFQVKAADFDYVDYADYVETDEWAAALKDEFGGIQLDEDKWNDAGTSSSVVVNDGLTLLGGGKVISNRGFSNDKINISYTFEGSSGSDSAFTLYDYGTGNAILTAYDNNGTFTVTNGTSTQTWGAYSPGTLYTVVIDIEKVEGVGAATCRIYTGTSTAGVAANTFPALSISYSRFQVAFSESAGETWVMRAIVAMPILVYYEDLIADLAQDIIDNEDDPDSKGKLAFVKTGNDANPAGRAGYNLFKGISETGSAVDRWWWHPVYDIPAGVTYDDCGFYIVEPNGLPDNVNWDSFTGDGTVDDWVLQIAGAKNLYDPDQNAWAGNKLFLLDAFSVSEDYSIVLEFDQRIGPQWSGYAGLSLSPAANFNFENPDNPHTGGPNLANMRYWDGALTGSYAAQLQYFAPNEQSDNGNLPDGGLPAGVRGPWFRNTVVINSSSITWYIESEMEAMQVVQTGNISEYLKDFMLHWHFGGINGMLECKNFSIKGIPGDGQLEEVELPPPPVEPPPPLEGGGPAIPESVSTEIAFEDDFVRYDGEKWDVSSGGIQISNGLTVGENGRIDSQRTFSPGNEMSLSYTFTGSEGSGSGLSGVFSMYNYKGDHEWFSAGYDNSTGLFTLSDGQVWDGYVPGTTYDVTVTFDATGQKLTFALDDNAGSSHVFNETDSLGYDVFRISFGERDDAVTEYASVKMEMPAYVFYDDLLSSLAQDIKDNGKTTKLFSGWYGVEAVAAGFPELAGASLFRGLGPRTTFPWVAHNGVLNSSQHGSLAGTDQGRVPTLGENGFFLVDYNANNYVDVRGDAGYTDEYILQVAFDKNSQSSLNNFYSLWLNESFPVSSNYDLVLEFESRGSRQWTSDAGIDFAVGSSFNFGSGPAEWIGNTRCTDDNFRQYIHSTNSGPADRWPEPLHPITNNFREIWMHNKITVTNTGIIWTVTNMGRDGKTPGETATIEGKHTLSSVSSAVIRWGWYDIIGILEYKNFSIKSVPGERGFEAPAMPKMPGTETPGDPNSVRSFIEVLEGDVDNSMLDPAMHGSYKSINRSIPDTLDLADRGALAVEGLINLLDGAVGETGEHSLGDLGLIGQTWLGSRTPFIEGFSFNSSGQANSVGGRQNWGKFAEAIIMGRNMSGVDYKLDEQMQSLINMLYYTIGDSDKTFETNVGARAYPHIFGVGDALNHFAVSPLGRVSMTLQSLFSLNSAGNTSALIDALDEIAQGHFFSASFKGTYDRSSELWSYDYGSTRWNSFDHERNVGGNLGWEYITHTNGNALRALSRYAGMNIGSKQDMTISVAGLYRNFYMLPQSKTEFTFWLPEAEPIAANSYDSGTFDGHMHAQLLTLLGMVEYGKLTNDTAALQLVRSSYENMRTFGLSSIGVVGETCSTGEIIALAVELSRAGVGDYWDDVDRYVRNHLAEIQFTDEKIAQMKAKFGSMGDLRVTDPDIADKRDIVGVYAADQNDLNDPQHVINRARGTFVADSTHPDHVHPRQQTIAVCCTANAMQGLYYAWEGIVTEKNGWVSVNLPLNRASKWLDVDSWLPYEGRVDLVMRQNVDTVDFRVPNYVEFSTVRVTDNTGRAVSFSWVGNRIVMNGLSAGAVISIKFDLENWTEVHTLEWIQSEDRHWVEGSDPRVNSSDPYNNPNPSVYTIVFRANTVLELRVANDPDQAKAQDLKLYRGEDRTGVMDVVNGNKPMPMKSGVVRYVPDTTLKP